MDFDSLLNYCIKLNDSSCDKCLVCHIPIENNDEHLKLKCTHLFHKNCIGYKNGSIKCLYCEKVSLPEIVNNSNKTILNNVLNINKQKEIYCKVILKTGPNKGQYCNRQECKYHKLQTNSVVVINSSSSIKKPATKLSQNKKTLKLNKCDVILKSGKKSGHVCGRNLPCKYHSKNLIKTDNNKFEENKISNTTTSFTDTENNLEQTNEDFEDLIEV